MSEYYLAVDIGASSGRHILAHIEEGKIVTEEVYRFDNGMTETDEGKIWDTEHLFSEIIAGMKKCGELGKIPAYMGIDTWAVDYVLLDESGNKLKEASAYRDDRTNGMDEAVYAIISEEELYKKTGIQKQIFNTIFQLMAEKVKNPEILDKAEHMLMIPDYLCYRLTGVMAQEYTNASTTGMLSVATNTWDEEIIEKLGLPRKLFKELKMPGEVLGSLSEEIAGEVGYSCNVVTVCSHDTASAVFAVPAEEEDFIYISSGTWSLMGTENSSAVTSDAAKVANLTNEGGFNYKYRFLKNIMGLWMIQNVRAELAPNRSYGEICGLASASDIDITVDVSDNRFLAPASMTKEVCDACTEQGLLTETGKPLVPRTLNEVAKVVYHSLATCYAKTINEIENITGKKYECIYVVGGGSNAGFLNEITAAETGRCVYAGPGEATAIGNIAVQMLSAGVFENVKEARKAIKNSFNVKVYKYKGE